MKNASGGQGATEVVFHVRRFGGREPPKSLQYRALRGGREPPKPPRERVDRVDLSTHASSAGGGGSWVDLSLLRADFEKERVGAARREAGMG